MSDYGFVHAGRTFTPNQTPNIAPESNAARNKAIEAHELELWDSRPDAFVAYYDDKRDTISTWLGTTIGAIVTKNIYRNNFGGCLISLKAKGTNGAIYHGRASYDWGNVVRLHRAKETTK